MFGIVFSLLMAVQSTAQPGPPDEIKEALSHAEALYYAARFDESIALLTRIDDVLKSQAGRQQEKIDTKLRLALAHIGMNETAKAKAFFMGVYALNPEYALDAQQFSPKVMAVASDAKNEQAKVRCSSAQTDARSYVEAGEIQSFLDLRRSVGAKCAVLEAMNSEAAEVAYKSGAAAYKRGEFSNALSGFEMALELSPEHELAREYADLTRGKIQVGQDRLLVQWQADFDAHRFTAAGAAYRQIVAVNERANTTPVSHIRSEYRKTLSSLVESWNQTCASGDRATLNAIRGQISELLPEPSFGEDIRSQMMPCGETNKPDTSATVKGNSSGSCFEMQPQLALTRLKTRVDPVFTNELRLYLKANPQVVVRVKARINENGDVTVTKMPDGNPILNSAVREAVAQWKFAPIRDDAGVRCVETEIVLSLKLAQ
ncbi:MAG: hypothetical protein DMG16_23530 [Acidobacteria bacterium]|nr:MAG: hypothetical protein DMG16_23530 [Acidobacteriota bacterium]